MPCNVSLRQGRTWHLTSTDTGSTGFGSVQVVPQDLRAARVAQLRHRLRLDLPDPLTRDAVDLADLVQRARLAVGEAEAQPDDAGLPLGQGLQDQLTSVLQTLSEREAGVVRLRFGLTDGQPRTLDEIGQVYGVTRERIRQIESKTMSKLRHPSRSQVLRDYLD